MVGRRLQQLRLARNLSLEALSAKMGGIVTRQAISKYENDKANPTPTVLARLANALNINASYLFAESSINVEFIAYRKSSPLLERESERIKSITQCELENRVEILDLLGQSEQKEVPIHSQLVKTMKDAEEASVELRNYWDLGLEPIQNVTETLESRYICVVDVDADNNFDGISAKAYDRDNNLKAVALVTRTDIDVVRRRLNLTHELGHVILDMDTNLSDKETEDAAFRFGAAFLAPSKTLFEEIGEERSAIQLQELFRLKEKFGLSIQAMILRLRQLDIINESYYWNLYSMINRLGWKKHEPEDWEPETSSWLEKNVIRLFTEGIVGKNYVKRILGERVAVDFPESVIQKQEFMKLPIEKRRVLLAEQAQKLARKYKPETEIIDGGDIVEY